MRLGSHDGTLRVVDAGEVVCRIDTSGWRESRSGPSVDPPVEAAISGQVSELRFPPGRVDLAGAPETEPLATGGGPVHVADGADILRIDAGVRAYLAPGGDATVTRLPRGTDVSFSGTAPVTVGVQSSGPDHTITVPGRPHGVATALTYASAAHETDGPSRSDPSRRPHPPAIERGDTVDVPDAVREATSETGIELRVPPNLDALFVLAPLAYYLGARVEIESRDAPILTGPGVRRTLPALPRLQAEAASLLYRTVTLDCLLRNARGERPSGKSSRLLDSVGIDPTLGDRPLAERLAAYVEAPFGTIEPSLPEWHLSMYVTPRPGNVSALPHVLDRLAFVYLPDATELEREERLRRSLEDFYRSPDAPTVEPLLPDLNRGRIHGWMADGVPIDAFTFLPEAYENRRRQPPACRDRTDVTVVLNDEAMSAEATAIARLYEERADDLGIDARVRRGLDRESLSAVLSRPAALFHYVGHCDREGLRCPDGHLSVEDVERSRARVFFLNACGSYHQGEALVQQGSVAGAVTLRPVLDEQATRVGTAFAQLVTRGLTVERSLRVACRRAIMNKDYGVVGDGSYALRTAPESRTGIATVARAGGDFQVTVENGSARSIGAYVAPILAGDPPLSGEQRRTSMSRAELCAFLDRRDLPVIYGNEYYWSDDLARELRGDETDEAGPR
jgi:hypothetical protein